MAMHIVFKTSKPLLIQVPLLPPGTPFVPTKADHAVALSARQCAIMPYRLLNGGLFKVYWLKQKVRTFPRPISHRHTRLHHQLVSPLFKKFSLIHSRCRCAALSFPSSSPRARYRRPLSFPASSPSVT